MKPADMPKRTPTTAMMIIRRDAVSYSTVAAAERFATRSFKRSATTLTAARSFSAEARLFIAESRNFAASAASCVSFISSAMRSVFSMLCLYSAIASFTAGNMDRALSSRVVPTSLIPASYNFICSSMTLWTSARFSALGSSATRNSARFSAITF